MNTQEILQCEDCMNPAELNRVRCAECLEKRRVIEARIREREAERTGKRGRPVKGDLTQSGLKSREWREKQRAKKAAAVESEPTPTPARTGGVKLRSDALKLVNDLPADKREKVEAIVRSHVQACRQNGFLPENLERVYVEAVELVDIEERFPEPEAAAQPYEPFRSYEQYRSPVMGAA